MSELDNYKPKRMLVFYENNLSKTYIEEHQIRKGKVSSGKPVPNEFFADYARESLKKDKVIIQGVPPKNVLNILFSSNTVQISWKTKPCIKELLFDSSMGLMSGMYPMPAMIWTYKWSSYTNDLSFVATDDKEFFIAPIPNNNTHFCFGNARVKPFKTYTEMINNVEESVYSSMFTHFSNAEIFIDKTNTEAFKELYEKKTFPTSWLNPKKFTLKSTL